MTVPVTAVLTSILRTWPPKFITEVKLNRGPQNKASDQEAMGVTGKA